jgi:outer membrane protein assembly factor BamD (BamD/ComL family)
LDRVGGPGVAVVYDRGQAYLRLGDAAGALEQFHRLIGNPGFEPLSWMHPLAQLGAARAYALARDVPAARGAYEAFFTLWADADQDVPVLIEARREYAALGASTGS